MLFYTKFQVSSLWFHCIVGIGLELAACLQVRLMWGIFSSLYDIPLHETPFQASPSPIPRVQIWRNKAVWKYSLQHKVFRITAPSHKSTVSDIIILWASY